MSVSYTNTIFFDGTVEPTDGVGISDAASYLLAPADIPEQVTIVEKTWLDTWLGTDTFSVTKAKQFLDTFLGTDVWNITKIIPKEFFDTFIGTDSWTLGRFKTFADTLLGTDSWLVEKAKQFLDAFTGTDSWLAGKAKIFADTLLGTDLWTQVSEGGAPAPPVQTATGLASLQETWIGPRILKKRKKIEIDQQFEIPIIKKARLEIEGSVSILKKIDLTTSESIPVFQKSFVSFSNSVEIIVKKTLNVTKQIQIKSKPTILFLEKSLSIHKKKKYENELSEIDVISLKEIVKVLEAVEIAEQDDSFLKNNDQ